MKKKIAMVVAVMTMWSGYMCHLQFGRDMDVVNCFSFSCSNFLSEDIRVNLNKAVVTESMEDIAESIIQRVLDNGFRTIKFNFDEGYSNRLKVSVYKDKKSIESGDMLFSFTYGQAADDGEIGAYDISQADHMKLEIYDPVF